ncbi:unnamed protein product, partial [Mesorhabditis spiculigera]
MASAVTQSREADEIDAFFSTVRDKKYQLVVELNCSKGVKEQLGNARERLRKLRERADGMIKAKYSTLPSFRDSLSKELANSVKRSEKWELNPPGSDFGYSVDERADAAEKRLTRLAVKARNMVPLEAHLQKNGMLYSRDDDTLRLVDGVLHDVHKRLTEKRHAVLNVPCLDETIGYGGSCTINDNFGRSVQAISSLVQALQYLREYPEIVGNADSAEIDALHAELSHFLKVLDYRLSQTRVYSPTTDLMKPQPAPILRSLSAHFSTDTTSDTRSVSLRPSTDSENSFVADADVLTAVAPCDRHAPTPESITPRVAVAHPSLANGVQLNESALSASQPMSASEERVLIYGRVASPLMRI